MADPDWRQQMLDSPQRAVVANRRIATAIDGALDHSADDVVNLISVLRAADRSDRQGILCSGMDIVEEIRSLVTGRSQSGGDQAE